MKAVFLDTSTFGKDFDFSTLKKLPIQWTFYPLTSPDETQERVAFQDIIITNKVKLTAEILENSSAKLICVTATGFDNIDIEAAKKRGIIVSNIPAYSTKSVAQLTITFILMLSSNVMQYIEDVRQGLWQKSQTFTFLDYPFNDLERKKLGIIGYGNIGQEVAKLARAFGMEILVAQGSKKNLGTLPLAEILAQSDYISIHIPLNPKTKNLIGKKELKLMKPTSFLINVSRGGLVNEEALAEALKSGTIAGAALDVLTKEPPTKDNPLLQKNIPNLLLTPHIAWGSFESRTKALKVLIENIEAFLSKKPQNMIV